MIKSTLIYTICAIFIIALAISLIQTYNKEPVEVEEIKPDSEYVNKYTVTLTQRQQDMHITMRAVKKEGHYYLLVRGVLFHFPDCIHPNH